MKIFIVNGAPGCGKTTFETTIQDNMANGMCLLASTIDFVKIIARKCGWDGSKTLKNRKFLSDLKDLLTEWDNVPFKKVMILINAFKKDVEDYEKYTGTHAAVFIDCREPQEIAKLKENIPGARAILIRRAEAEEQSVSNHADADYAKYNEYDIIIDNNGSLSNFSATALAFIDKENLIK